MSSREDLASTVHIAINFAWLASGVAGLASAATPGSTLAASAWLGLGIAGVFPAFHEALHRTAFTRRGANDLIAAITAFFQVASPTAYRAFHWHHHRHTHSVEDPEISVAPSWLAPWPPLFALPIVLSGQPILWAKAGMLLTFLTPHRLWADLAPYVTAVDRRRVGIEAALVLAGHLAMTAWLGWGWPLAVVLGHAGMGPWRSRPASARVRRVAATSSRMARFAASAASLR